MSKLDNAMLQHIHYLVETEHTSFCFLNFCSEKVRGEPYAMAHGTFRNKISKLVKAGIVELECNSVPAFYRLKGVRLGKQQRIGTMTNMMTLSHMVDTPVTNVINSSICDTIQNLPPEKKALHDIHMKFQVAGIWKNISLCGKYEMNSNSKDIPLLSVIGADNLKIRITVHHTDTVTAVAACSNAPIVADVEGLIRLTIALTRVEERLSRIVEECGKNQEGLEPLAIPEHDKWIVKLWHVGIDSDDYEEFRNESERITWQDMKNNVLCREYFKKNYDSKEGKGRSIITRHEIQEYPSKTLAEAIKEKFGGIFGGHIL